MISNNMTRLINRIEIRLGTKKLNLPKECSKDKWVDIVKEMTIPIYSSYFPHKIKYKVVPSRDYNKKLNCYMIDEDIIPGDIKILGIVDYVFKSTSNAANNAYTAYGQYDFFTNAYNIEDIGLAQCAADLVSLVNNGIFVEYQDPHMIKVTNSIDTDLVKHTPEFEVELFIEHSDSLATIEPTKIVAFENLAMADIATFLYGELKYFDNLETVFGNIDIKLSDIQNIAEKRDEYIGALQDAYVGPSNKNMPLMYMV